MQKPIDLDHLQRLRLVVGRVGEMDIAKWWNTNGQLGRLGAAALRRGFPRTHYFAQARSVFAVAAHRCHEVFDPPGCVTLWQMPPAVEDEFDARWEHWLDNAIDWIPFFKKIEGPHPDDLVAAFGGLEIVREGDLDKFSHLRRSAEGRAVPLPGFFSGSNEDSHSSYAMRRQVPTSEADEAGEAAAGASVAPASAKRSDTICIVVLVASNDIEFSGERKRADRNKGCFRWAARHVPRRKTRRRQPVGTEPARVETTPENEWRVQVPRTGATRTSSLRPLASSIDR